MDRRDRKALIVIFVAAVVAIALLVFVGLPLSPEKPSTLSTKNTPWQAAPDPTVRQCDGLDTEMPTGYCRAASWIRFAYLYNLQGAGQFCKWEAANPGEWSRIKGYASSGVVPERIVTWLGGGVRDSISSYFETGAPPFNIQPNTSPNRCKTPLVPPVITGVTPGQTQVTITIAPG